MPRKLVNGADFPSGYRGRLIRLAEVTTEVGTHYFATERVSFGGNLHEPWLVANEAIRRHRSLQVDSAVLSLQNADRQMEALIFSEQFEGAKVKLLDLLYDLDPANALELVRGVLSDREMAEATVEWSIVPTWDATSVEAPRRVFSRTCTFRFKGAECGYVDGVDPDDPGTGLPFLVCPKDFAACQARGRAHRYPGFIHITRELQQVYPPRSRDEIEDGNEGAPWGSGRWDIT